MTKPLAQQMVDAVQNGDAAKVGALLARGVPPNAVARNGTTALYGATMSCGGTASLDLVLAAGADPNVESTGSTDGTPLCGAACWGYAEVVEALLAHGADPNMREDGGTDCTPLWWASRGGHEESVRLLLDAGAEPNARVGRSPPLVDAVEFGSLGVVRLLLTHGADPEMADGRGRAPLKLAEEFSGSGIEASLRARAAAAGWEEVECRRTVRTDGSEVIVASPKDGTGLELEQGTGHPQIADVLRQAIGSQPG